MWRCSAGSKAADQRENAGLLAALVGRLPDGFAADCFAADGFARTALRAGPFVCLRLRVGGVTTGAGVASASASDAGVASAVATVTGSAAAGASHAPAVPEASGCTAAGVGRPFPREATTTAETPVTNTSAATPAAISRRSRGVLRAISISRRIWVRACRAPIRAAAVTARADVRPAAADQRVARASTGLLRRVAASAKDRSAPRADDVTSLARRTNARGSGRAGAIGSRSSNRIGSGAGSATSGGAAAKNPCSSSSKGSTSNVRASLPPVSSAVRQKNDVPCRLSCENPSGMIGYVPICALALLMAAPTLTRGEDVVAHARAAESAQLHGLARAPVALHTTGHFGDGKTTHSFESFRRVEYRADGGVSNKFERGQVDGKAATEAELRKAMGVKQDPKDNDDVLTWALAPFSSPDMEVTPVGPATGGGYALRCRVKRDALVGVVVVIVDETTGRKRAATIQMAGLKAKLADRLENVLVYADDGAPARFHSSFHFKMAWIERSAEIDSERVPPPGAPK